jgi:hypothetical protein
MVLARSDAHSVVNGNPVKASCFIQGWTSFFSCGSKLFKLEFNITRFKLEWV